MNIYCSNDYEYLRKKNKLPKLAIIGAGSIGQLCYQQIAKHKIFEVFFCDPRKATNKYTSSAFLTKRKRSFRKASLLSLKNIAYADLILITTKAYSLVSVVEKIGPYLKPNAELIFLVNGMGAQEKAKLKVFAHRVYFASTTNGAVHKGFYCEHRGIGQTAIGSSTQKLNIKSRNIKLLCVALKNCKFVDNITPILLQKLTVNAIINPLSAIYHCKNGDLLSHSSEIKALCIEITPIVNRLGLSQSFDTILQNSLKIMQATADNFSSMEQDYLYNRKSEIEYILGFLIAKAKLLNLPSNCLEAVYHKLNY